MAFAWKLFNDIDLKSVKELEGTVQNIVKNHEKLETLPFDDLAKEENEALQKLLKKYSKKLEEARETFAAFDQELEAITSGIFEKEGR